MADGASTDGVVADGVLPVIAGRMQIVAILVTCIVASGFGVAPAEAREVRYGDLVIRPLPDLPQTTTHGYHEFSFLVINESPVASRRVTLSGPQSSQVDVGLQGLSQIERSVTVGPGSTARLDLVQPPLPVFGNSLEVRLDGQLQRELVPWVSAHPEYWVGNPRHIPSLGPDSRRLLISQRLDEDSFPPHSDDDYRVSRATIGLSAWSENWLAYSGYDGIVTTVGELEQAPRAVLEALWHYVETGGVLVSLGSAPADSPWLSQRRRRAQASAFEQGVDVDYVGFGVVLSAEAATVAAASPGQVDRLEAAWHRSREPWARARDPVSMHRQFPVAAKIEVPVRSLFVVVLLFTILIGPVNLIWLSRRNRRMWLLWTVPGLSLLACLAVMGWVLAKEGVVRFQRSEVVTVLDERLHRATSYGWAGYYATLTPGDGLRFGLETEVSPVLAWTGDKPQDISRSIAWGETQHLDKGWLRARLPSYFIVRKSEQRRERLSLRWSADGGLEVVNGLGVSLKALWVAGPSGRLYRADQPLAAGASVALELAEDTAKGGADALRRIYQGDLPGRSLQLEQEPAEFLRPGTYLAITDDTPFLEDGLDRVDRNRRSTVIYGISPDPTSAELGP